MTLKGSPFSVRCGSRGGFSLIELLLVLVILSVLAAIVVPKFTGQSERARVSAANLEIHNLEGALDRFEIDMGRFPTTQEGLYALFENPSSDTEDEWQGPYMKRGVFEDPWGNEYIYEYPGSYNENYFDLYSMGPDRQKGTEDDIVNWSEEYRR